MNEMLIGIIVNLGMIIFSGIGFWLVFLRKLITREEAQTLIANNLINRPEIMSIIEQSNIVIKAELEHIKEFYRTLTVALEKNTTAVEKSKDAINELRVEIAKNAPGPTQHA